MNKFKIKEMLYTLDIKNRELSILLYLVDRCDKDFTCFPSIKTISNQLKISISTVKRGLISLSNQNYIKKIERFSDINGRQTSNLYVINIDKLQKEHNHKTNNKTKITEDVFLNEIEYEQQKQHIYL